MKKTLVLLGLTSALSVFAEDLPKAADGFEWHEFSKECAVIQVPRGWQWREKDNHPAQTVFISPQFTESGGFDSGFTLSAVACRNEQEWKEAYESAHQFWVKTADSIKAMGKPTVEKTMQSPNQTMQLLVIEGDLYLPQAPHPKEKYHVRTMFRAIPPAGLVYVYSIRALAKDWDEIWKNGQTMLEPIVFRVPGATADQHAGATDQGKSGGAMDSSGAPAAPAGAHGPP